MRTVLWQLWQDRPVQQSILLALSVIVCLGVVLQRADWRIWPWVVVWIWPTIKLMSNLRDVQGLAMLNAVIAAPFATSVLASRSRRGRKLLLGICAAALVACATGIGAVALAGRLSSCWPPIATRWAGGPFLSSNHLAAALAFGLVTTTVFASVGSSRLRTCACWIGSALQLALLLGTLSRGALLATVVALSVGTVALRVPRRSRVLLAGSIVVVLAAAAVYWPMRSRLELALEGPSPNNTEGLMPRLRSAHPERWMATHATAAAIAQNWLTGVESTGMFGGIRVEGPDGQVQRISGSYTMSLNWAWRFGIPTAAASAVLILLSVFAGLRSDDLYVASVAAGALALVVNSAVTDIWQHPLLAFELSAISMLLWLLWRSRRVEHGVGMPRVPQRMSTRRATGFTLVELLVVISILALLLGILLPALGRSRHQARAVVCMTRVRSLGDCTSIYAGEFARYPPSLMNTPGEWLAGWVGFDWLGVGHHGDGRNFAPRRGLYWKYVDVAEIYNCPQESVGAGGGSTRFSYAMNGRVGLLVPGAYTRHRERSELPRLSDAVLSILFEEAGPREGCFSGRDIPNNRHGDKTNVGFADGHVSGQRYAPGLNANGICRELDFDPPLIIVPD